MELKTVIDLRKASVIKTNLTPKKEQETIYKKMPFLTKTFTTQLLTYSDETNTLHKNATVDCQIHYHISISRPSPLQLPLRTFYYPNQNFIKLADVTASHQNRISQSTFQSPTSSISLISHLQIVNLHIS
jgi:hypothetical protein